LDERSAKPWRIILDFWGGLIKIKIAQFTLNMLTQRLFVVLLEKEKEMME